MKNLSQHSHLTIGLDLGNKQSDYCIVDKQENVLARGKVLSRREPLKEFLLAYPGALVVCEVGSHSRWVQQLVERLPLRIIVADPRQIALITRSHRKNDKRDAELLAKVGACMPSLLHPVTHKGDEFYADLAVIETRNVLTAERTKLTNRIKGLCKAQGEPLSLRGGRAFHKKAPEHIPEHLLPSTTPLLALLKAIDEQIGAIDKTLDAIAEKYPVVAKFRQIHGVGIQTALTFALTICDSARFGKTRDVAAYLGLVPRQRASGDSDPQLAISKAGDGNLRRLLVLCAHYILSRGNDCGLRRWGLVLCERGGKNGKKRACVAVARKLAVLLLALWKSGEDYDPMRNVTESAAA